MHMGGLPVTLNMLLGYKGAQRLFWDLRGVLNGFSLRKHKDKTPIKARAAPGGMDTSQTLSPRGLLFL